MKKIIKSFAVFSFALLAVSCNTDFVGTVYDGQGSPTFAQAVINNVEIPSSETTYFIPINRSSLESAQTVSIEATLPEGITCPTSVEFAPGAYTTNLVLDISKMEIGESYTGTIKLAGLTDEQKNIATSTINFKLAKAYTWNSLGTGFFFDGFWEGFISECEILKADGFERYRVMNPYSAAEEKGGPAIFEFWVINEDGNVKFDTFTTPFDYSGEGDFIKGYWPSSYSEKYAGMEASSGFYDKDIAVLFPCWYVDDVGGWPGKYYPISICLPGKSEDEYIDWLTEFGIY